MAALKSSQHEAALAALDAALDAYVDTRNVDYDMGRKATGYDEALGRLGVEAAEYTVPTSKAVKQPDMSADELRIVCGDCLRPGCSGNHESPAFRSRRRK